MPRTFQKNSLQRKWYININILNQNMYTRMIFEIFVMIDFKIFFITIIDLKYKNDQNKLKYFIKRSKYILIPLELINVDIRVYS